MKLEIVFVEQDFNIKLSAIVRKSSVRIKKMELNYINILLKMNFYEVLWFSYKICVYLTKYNGCLAFLFLLKRICLPLLWFFGDSKLITSKISQEQKVFVSTGASVLVLNWIKHVRSSQRLSYSVGCELKKNLYSFYGRSIISRLSIRNVSPCLWSGPCNSVENCRTTVIFLKCILHFIVRF